jgi:hypothetical protein
MRSIDDSQYCHPPEQLLQIWAHIRSKMVCNAKEHLVNSCMHLMMTGKTVEKCCDINKSNWMLYILSVALDGTSITEYP